MDIPPDLRTLAPGAAGSILAALLAKERTFWMRCALVAPGVMLAWLATPVIVRWSDYLEPSDAGLVGFLLGWMGIAFFAKLFDTIEAIDPKEALRKIWTKIGLGD